MTFPTDNPRSATSQGFEPSAFTMRDSLGSSDLVITLHLGTREDREPELVESSLESAMVAFQQARDAG